MISSETKRLEQLWRGEFGNDYIDRNKNVAVKRLSFWKKVVKKLYPKNVLEVGCNIGANIECMSKVNNKVKFTGVDINKKALKILKNNNPDVNVFNAAVKNLPFRDKEFDIVVSVGVLIHQSEESIKNVLKELERCSNKYILIGEYFSEATVEVKYHGQKGTLFKRNYGKLFEGVFKNIKLVDKEFLDKNTGFDDITVWIYQK